MRESGRCSCLTLSVRQRHQTPNRFGVVVAEEDRNHVTTKNLHRRREARRHRPPSVST